MRILRIKPYNTAAYVAHVGIKVFGLLVTEKRLFLVFVTRS